MFSQITRLEFGIVVAVLLVLFLCRQPPKSGNADVPRDTGPAQQAPLSDVKNSEHNVQETGTFNPQSAIRDPQLMGPQPPIDAAPAAMAASHNRTAEPPIPPPPQMKPLGLVDARKCPGLNYDDILYGEVTVRWVWNGTGFVPHKVVVVREKSGVISTWSFEDRDDIVVTPLTQQTR